jgi:hypothetical protein
MARLINKEIKHCRCCSCKAEIVKWSCGCITVNIKNEKQTKWCSNCDNFSILRKNCGKGGCPEG